MDDTAPKLTTADLILFGRYYREALEEPGKGAIHLSPVILRQYLISANEALVLLQQREQARKPKKPSGGRPAGTSMGAQVMRLRDAGMDESLALREVERETGKSGDSVLRSYDAARKKPAHKKTARKKPAL
jgi:hypothetical protein